ncbi:MFS transporter [Yokenella regensburgei]|uniref:MFS transporter n=1 Tax=Yokenella regensburgei TaxID=158877 RepID=UPI003ED93805
MSESSSQVSSLTALKTFCVSGLGTALEFYDFIIYGTAAALVFPQVFFPEIDRLMGTLISLSAFGAGFLARPVGGILFGHFGDKFSRKKVLMTTMTLMGASTFMIGCLPGHATLGIMAPVLLVLLRLLQGLAAGGEWGGAALFGIESAPKGRRGLWGSFTSMGIGIGGIFGSAVFGMVSLASGGNLAEFAWRIPFWLGGVLVLFGLYARMRNMTDDVQKGPKHDIFPIVAAWRQRPRELLLCTGIAFGYVTIAYIGSTFFLAYATQLGYSNNTALLFDIMTSVTIILSAPLFGHLSDKYGRRNVMVFGGFIMAIGFFIFFPVVRSMHVTMSLIAYAMIGTLMGATQGPIPAFLGEQFPQEMRYSGISASYQIGAALGGGTASSIATSILIMSNQNPTGVAIYGALALALLAWCTRQLRETSHLSMEEINNAPPLTRSTSSWWLRKTSKDKAL